MNGTEIPPTINPALFLSTVVFLPGYIYFAKRASDRCLKDGGQFQSWQTRVTIAVGVGLTLIHLYQLRYLPLATHTFGAFFAWGCAHGMPAFLFGRIVWSIWRSKGKGFRERS